MAEEVGTLAEALYDFDGVRDDNVPFKKGEILTIIEMNEGGWWKGANAEGRVGIFPYNYCQVRLDSNQNFPLVKAISDFDGQSDEDLSFAMGDLITVIRQITADWSEGKAQDGRRGRFPMNFVQDTGEFDEATQREETEKWERIEAEKVAQLKKLKAEREEAERKIREEEEKRRIQEEKERKIREEAEAKARLQREANEAKMHAKKMENEKIQREAEMQAEQLRLQAELDKAKLEREQHEQQLKRDAAEAKRRAELAERELEQARAEAAVLRKQQAQVDARKSKVILQKIEADNEAIIRKVNAAAKHNAGHAPGPPPKLPEDPLANTIVDPSVPTEEPQPEEPKKKKKNKGALQVTYVDKEEALPVEEKPKEPEPEPQVRKRRQKKKAPANPKFAHLGGGNKCPSCGKGVGVGDKVNALGEVWHSKCFTCATCSKVLRQGQYRDHQGTAYCTSCHNKGFGISGYGYGVGAGVLSPKSAAHGTKATGAVVTESVFAKK